MSRSSDSIAQQEISGVIPTSDFFASIVATTNVDTKIDQDKILKKRPLPHSDFHFHHHPGTYTNMPTLSMFRKNHGLVTMPKSPHKRHSLDASASSSSSQHSTISVDPTRKGPLTCSSSSPERRERARKVTFRSHVHIYATIHRSHYSEEEMRNTWATSEDLRTMKVERNNCLRILHKVCENIDDDTHYFRGLENKTLDGYKRRRFLIADACMAVMDEQAAQMDLCLHNPDAIAQAYMACTAGCVDAARQRGQYDELAAVSASSTPTLALCEKVAA